MIGCIKQEKLWDFHENHSGPLNVTKYQCKDLVLLSPFVSAHFFLLTSYRFNSSPPFSFYFLSFFFLFSEDSLFSQVVLRLLYNFHEIAVS